MTKIILHNDVGRYLVEFNDVSRHVAVYDVENSIISVSYLNILSDNLILNDNLILI